MAPNLEGDMSTTSEQLDPEIAAISTVFSVLKDLSPDAQSRVLDYVRRKLRGTSAEESSSRESAQVADDAPGNEEVSTSASKDIEADDGINAVAQKWMRRNGLTATSLGALFSLGVDDIELVAKKVPGKSKRERTHSVVLLKGIASYLGSGAARFTHADLKETCLHYDAYDVANSTAYMKSFASEVAGSARTGYTLSARGLAAATELVKSLVAAK